MLDWLSQTIKSEAEGWFWVVVMIPVIFLLLGVGNLVDSAVDRLYRKNKE